jgi:hypothetical protein
MPFENGVIADFKRDFTRSGYVDNFLFSDQCIGIFCLINSSASETDKNPVAIQVPLLNKTNVQGPTFSIRPEKLWILGKLLKSIGLKINLIVILLIFSFDI